MNLQCSHFGPKALWTMSNAAYACSLVPIPQMLSLTQLLQHVFRYVSGIHVVIFIFHSVLPVCAFSFSFSPL